MAVRLSALRTGRCFTPQKHYFMLLVLISVRGWSSTPIQNQRNNYSFAYSSFSMLGGSLVTTAWTVLGLQKEHEWAAAHKWLGVDLQLGDRTWYQSPLTIKNMHVTQDVHQPYIWMNSLDKWTAWQNTDTSFGTWNVRSLYKAGSQYYKN
jgi:hypothetical protein